MKTAQIENVGNVPIKLQAVKVTIGGVVADEEMALQISEDMEFVEVRSGVNPILLTYYQAKKLARQLYRMAQDLKTAERIPCRNGLGTNLTDRERFCLDAYIRNGDARTAYRLSRETPPTEKPNTLSVLVARWINSDKVKDYIEKRKEQFSMNGAIAYTPIEDTKTP